jgi:hypothetical protein
VVWDGGDTQQKIFEHITVASTLLENPDNAPAEIDRVLSAAGYLRGLRTAESLSAPDGPPDCASLNMHLRTLS